MTSDSIKDPAIDAVVRANAAFIHGTSNTARERGALSLWTVYDHPKDYPDSFVARRFEAGGGEPAPMVTADVVTGSLDVIRESMAMCGLVCMTRAPSDDSRILETWL